MGQIGSDFDGFLEEQGLLDQCRNEAIARRNKMTKFAKVMAYIGIIVLAIVVVVIPTWVCSFESVDKALAVAICLNYAVWVIFPIVNWLKKQVVLMAGKKEE